MLTAENLQGRDFGPVQAVGGVGPQDRREQAAHGARSGCPLCEAGRQQKREPLQQQVHRLQGGCWCFYPARSLRLLANVQGQVAQNNATRCQKCAYKKGLCAICGNIVLDTKGYKQSSK